MILAEQRASDWVISSALHAGLLGAVLLGSLHWTEMPEASIPKDLSILWAPPPVAQALTEKAHVPVLAPVPNVAPTPPKRVAALEQAAPAMPTLHEPTTTQPSGPRNTPASGEHGRIQEAADTSTGAPPNAAPPPAAQPVPAATPTVAPKSADSRPWQAHLEHLLQRNKQYPTAARRMRQAGVVTVDAWFDEAGILVHCAVVVSSGYRVLDEAAIALVRSASEIARLQHTPGRAAELRLPITYELKES
ncbi:TonB Periplasmic protein TonB, links inner and outer membranes [Comamonadaceae bacterium]|jgi:protein TonB